MRKLEDIPKEELVKLVIRSFNTLLMGQDLTYETEPEDFIKLVVNGKYCLDCNNYQGSWRCHIT